MTLLSIALVTLLFSVGAFLMMRPHLMKFAIGFVCFTNGANLLIFLAGRLTKAVPPLIPEGSSRLISESANPLSQALILTAIVIGFGFLAFVLVLTFKASSELGAIDNRAITSVDEEVE